MNENMYSYNFAWIDSFMSSLPYHKERHEIFNNKLGLPLDTEVKYDIVVTAQATKAYTLFLYGIFQRILRISPVAIQIA